MERNRSKPKRKIGNSNRPIGNPDMEVTRQDFKMTVNKNASENKGKDRESPKRLKSIFKKEIEILKIKNKITEINNFLYVFNSMGEDKKHEDSSRENIQTEVQSEKMIENIGKNFFKNTP